MQHLHAAVLKWVMENAASDVDADEHSPVCGDGPRLRMKGPYPASHRSALSTVEACKVLYQMASALNHLNAHNAIHRDLKPEQCLLGQAMFDQVHLGDYGSARFFPEGIDQAHSDVTHHELSPGYGAPEGA